MQAIVLAAGDGGRLHPLTAETPKPLLCVAGQPLINHVLDALSASGVHDVTVVVGYRGDQIREALARRHPEGMRVRFVENADYEQGNARSIWAARNAVDGSFVLTMADHIVDPAIIGALVSDGNGRCRLAVERASPGDARAHEATRARVQGGRVTELGKAIETWNAFDTGVFWCAPRIFSDLTPSMRDGEAAAVFSALARADELDAVDVTGYRWIDIDTPDDLSAAEAMLADGGRAN